MIRNEIYEQGVVVDAEVIDLDAGTFTIERNGQIESVRDLTDDEITAYTPKLTARESAMQKLAALGLTADEVAALLSN